MSQTLKSRISVIILMALLLTSLAGTTCYAAEASTPTEETKQAVEVKLNRKVFFEGKTYWRMDGKGRTRKEYKDGKIGCGIIGGITSNKPFGIYVIGEGYISKDQITKPTEKFISLKFDKVEDGLGAKTQLKINGEFVAVDSDNTGIIKYEKGKLIAGGIDGTTTIKITTKSGKEYEALATVYKGDVELNIEQGTLSLSGMSTTEMADKKLKLEAGGNADLGVVITEDGIAIGADGEANAKINFKETEILDANATASGSAILTRDGVEVEGNASQRGSLFKKLNAKLSQRAKASINKERADVSVGGDVEVDDKEIASADAGLGYEYATDTGTASIKASALGNEVVNAQKDFNPVTTLKTLLSKLMKK